MREKAKYVQLFEQLKGGNCSGNLRKRPAPAGRKRAGRAVWHEPPNRAPGPLPAGAGALHPAQAGQRHLCKPGGAPAAAGPGTWEWWPPPSASTFFPPSCGALRESCLRRAFFPCFPPPKTGWTTSGAFWRTIWKKGWTGADCGGHQKRSAQPQPASV